MVPAESLSLKAANHAGKHVKKEQDVAYYDFRVAPHSFDFVNYLSLFYLCIQQHHKYREIDLNWSVPTLERPRQ